MAEHEQMGEAEAMGGEAEMFSEEEEEEEEGEGGQEFVIRIRPPRLLPGETRDHMRAARKETLLAVRSVLDAMIDRLERPEKRKKRTKKIEIG